ncbi:MAG: NAD(P)-dependent oxidoreductase [Planctomycetota bacterium]
MHTEASQSHASDSVCPDKTSVGWIGAGVMGHSMAKRILDAGYEVHVTSRTPSKCDSLVNAGAHRLEAANDLTNRCDVIFSIVGTPDDVRDIYLSDRGLLANCRPGQIFVDMTTSSPSLAKELAAVALSREAVMLDAPVSGGDIGAQSGALSIMIGGDADAVNSLEPLWKCMGQTIVHQGAAGMGQHTKMVNQTLIASTMIGVCEALLYAERAGLDVESVLQSVSKGAAGSVALSVLAPRILKGDFDPGFFVEHFIKDMGIVLQEATAMNLCLPGIAQARQLYQALAAQGHARLGTQSLIIALAKLNAIDRVGEVQFD